jgi:glyceraldehyde-3-phosphate dehydrogenase/erythrose-4-phosphate dehydrogenase
MTKDEEIAQFELQVESRDEVTVKQIELSLQSVDVKRWPAARMDPITVLAIAAAAVKLVIALVELKRKLDAQSNPPPVRLLNAAGAAIDLATATEPALMEFITGIK